MRSLFNRQFDMLVRALAFGQKYTHLFPTNRLAGKLFAKIAALLPQLGEAAGSHAAGAALAEASLTSKASARAVLFECLDKISLTARAMARENPQVRNKFKTPYSVSDREVINKAN